MIDRISAALSALLIAGPALAESHAAAEGTEMAEGAEMAEMAEPTGDAAAGEEVFAKRCTACHVVVNEAGDKLAGKSARTGPNLFRVAGHPAGMDEDYRYGKDLAAAGAEQGLVWSEENFAAYVADPRGFLRDFTGDSSARSKMSFRLRDEEDAINIYAYLVSLDDM